SCSWSRRRWRTCSRGSSRARRSPPTSSTSASGMRRWSSRARTTTTTSCQTRPGRSRRPRLGSTRSSAPRRPGTRIVERGSELKLDVVTAEGIAAVAVDAAGGAGLRPFSYRVPQRLVDLAAGEAVLVEFGRRQALGIVLGPGAEVEGVETKPILDRVRADGPLLPKLGMRLAAWIAEHYLAPPAITLRAMLPPGLLERLELVAELRPPADAADTLTEQEDAEGAPPSSDGLSKEDLALLETLAAGPRQVRQLEAPEGRPALLRRLRALEAAGRLDLDWTLLAAGAAPRWVRYVRLTPTRDAAASGTSNQRLGPRQQALIGELEAGPANGL